jgi:hypothetical protein
MNMSQAGGGEKKTEVDESVRVKENIRRKEKKTEEIFPASPRFLLRTPKYLFISLRYLKRVGMRSIPEVSFGCQLYCKRQ